MKITNLGELTQSELSDNSLLAITNGSSAELKKISFGDLKSKINSSNVASTIVNTPANDNFNCYGFSFKLSSINPSLIGTKIKVTNFAVNGASSGDPTQAVYIRLVTSPIDNALYTIAEPTYEQLGQSFLAVSDASVQIPTGGTGVFSFTDLELEADKTYFALFQSTNSTGFNSGLVQTRFGLAGTSTTIYNRLITGVSQKRYSFAEYIPSISIQGDVVRSDQQTRLESIGDRVLQLEKVLYSITRS